MESGKVESDNDDSPNWFERNSFFIKVSVGSLILLIGFVISAYIVYVLKSLIGIGIMGLGILITVLIGGNVLSKEHELTTGEVRRAIAISCISVFFGLLAFGDTITMNNKDLGTVLENFWWIIITIIGFYFGGRSAEKIIESISEKWAKKLEDKVENIKKKLDDMTVSEIRKQIIEGLKGAKFPINTPEELLNAFPEGAETTFKAGDVEVTAGKAGNLLTEKDFPFSNAEQVADTIVERVERAGL